MTIINMTGGGGIVSNIPADEVLFPQTKSDTMGLTGVELSFVSPEITSDIMMTSSTEAFGCDAGHFYKYNIQEGRVVITKTLEVSELTENHTPICAMDYGYVFAIMASDTRIMSGPLVIITDTDVIHTVRIPYESGYKAFKILYNGRDIHYLRSYSSYSGGELSTRISIYKLTISPSDWTASLSTVLGGYSGIDGENWYEDYQINGMFGNYLYISDDVTKIYSFSGLVGQSYRPGGSSGTTFGRMIGLSEAKVGGFLCRARYPVTGGGFYLAPYSSSFKSTRYARRYPGCTVIGLTNVNGIKPPEGTEIVSTLLLKSIPLAINGDYMQYSNKTVKYILDGKLYSSKTI